MADAPTYVHRKSGGRYTLLGTGRLQSDTPLADMAEIAIYRGEDGRLWARDALEFAGRFDEAPPSPPVAAPAEPVAYLLMRKDAKGVWQRDGRLWHDAPPHPEVIENVAQHLDEWRIDYAYLGAPQPPRPGTAPLSDEQRQDLLAAAFFIAGRKEPGAMLKDEDADRIADLLTELSGFDLDSIGHPTTPTPKE